MNLHDMRNTSTTPPHLLHHFILEVAQLSLASISISTQPTFPFFSFLLLLLFFILFPPPSTAHRVDSGLIALDKKHADAKGDTAACAAISKQVTD